jgi:hypothetical protein
MCVLAFLRVCVCVRARVVYPHAPMSVCCRMIHTEAINPGIRRPAAEACGASLLRRACVGSTTLPAPLTWRTSEDPTRTVGASSRTRDTYPLRARTLALILRARRASSSSAKASTSPSGLGSRPTAAIRTHTQAYKGTHGHTGTHRHRRVAKVSTSESLAMSVPTSHQKSIPNSIGNRPQWP